MSDQVLAAGAWWSLARANTTVLGVVVAVVAIAALGFVAHRLVARRRP